MPRKKAPTAPLRRPVVSESVWDYPRPPRLEPATRRARIVLGGATVCDTPRALRILETSHPPTYYVPFADCDMTAFAPAPGSSSCEWKGRAVYLADGAAWHYPDPVPAYAALTDHLAVYVSRMDACFLDDERVSAQPGDPYGGAGAADLDDLAVDGRLPETRGW